MKLRSRYVLLYCLLPITTLNAMDTSLPVEKKTFMQAATSMAYNTVTGIGESLKRNWKVEIGPTKVEFPISLDISQQTAQTLAKLSVPEGGIGAKVILQPETNKAFDQATQAMVKAGDSVKTLTEKYHPQKGLIFTLDTGEGINKIANDGIKAHLSIDPSTVKTLFISSTGAALAMAGIGLILYESFFVEDYSTEAPKPASWSMTVKNFMKNRYVLGSASIAAGLCLIAKSTSL